MVRKFIRPLIGLFLAIAIPVAAFSIISNLPAPEPPLSGFLKAHGYFAVDGRSLEEQLAKNTELSFNGETAVIACPASLIITEDQPGLCGYCKVKDSIVYPFWQEGFTKKLQAATHDFRYHYRDFLHNRYVLLSQSENTIFEVSKSAGNWRDDYGHWFMCQNSEHLDVNAVIEVRHDSRAQNALKVSTLIGPYETLAPVRDQLTLPAEPKAKP